jgi:hypothetical protein
MSWEKLPTQRNSSFITGNPLHGRQFESSLDNASDYVPLSIFILIPPVKVMLETISRSISFVKPYFQVCRIEQWERLLCFVMP